MLNGLDFIMLHVPNLPEAKSFYMDKLGFDVEDENPVFVQFKRSGEGAILALQESEGAAPTQSVELWWLVDDVDAVYSNLSAQGVEIISKPEDKPFGRTLSIMDPAGHTVNMFKLAVR